MKIIISNLIDYMSLKAQKVGNCWIKQPMRGMLATLYVELLSNRQDLTPDSAWTEAKCFYKSIQRAVAIPLVERLIDQSSANSEMKQAALLALEKQKQL